MTDAIKLVPVPSKSMIPERDIDKKPVLEVYNLGIEFGGLHAVEDFSIALGRTEISGYMESKANTGIMDGASPILQA